jgi:hypothetical protein
MRDPAPSPDATMKRISRFLAMAQLFSLACPMIALAQQPSRGVQRVRAVSSRPVTRALPSVIVLDMNGDGVSLEGSTRTSLLTGGPVSARWTSAGGDEAFLMVDATSLRAAGVSLMNSSSEPLEGNQLFRDGLRVKDAAGAVSPTRDAAELLPVLDANGDGRVDASDPAWGSLRLFVDKNADGTVNAGELSAMADARMGGLDARIGDAAADATADTARRSRGDASFSTADGATRTMSSVATTP